VNYIKVLIFYTTNKTYKLKSVNIQYRKIILKTSFSTTDLHDKIIKYE